MTGRRAKLIFIRVVVFSALALIALGAALLAMERHCADVSVDTRRMLSVTRNGRTVTFVECPECEKPMRIAADGMSATINLCRLRDGNPDAKEFARRRDEMIERAFAAMAELSGDYSEAGN